MTTKAFSIPDFLDKLRVPLLPPIPQFIPPPLPKPIPMWNLTVTVPTRKAPIRGVYMGEYTKAAEDRFTPSQTIDMRKEHVDLVNRVRTYASTVTFDAASLPVTFIEFYLLDDTKIIIRPVMRVAERDGQALSPIYLNGLELVNANDQDAWAGAVQRALHKIVTHEVDECLKIGGVRVFDPHRNEVP